MHCADSEAYGHAHPADALADPGPVIIGYDENAWAKVFDFTTATIPNSQCCAPSTPCASAVA
ncbi:MAG: hypothetical protein IPK67_20690 [Planctomycetes bacterium]|nr:hypothetical protein [Planctomycetota bacterium]